MSRRFTFREMILLIVCALIGLGIFYYEFAYKGFQNALNAYNVEDLENQVVVYQAQVAKKKSMEAYISEHQGENLGELAIYNNLANEINELGRIFEGIDDISISWGDPTLMDTTVRRNARVTLKTRGYDSVIRLVNNINNCAYRCLISDLSISAARNEVLDSSAQITVNIVITFFERIDENSNLEGLTILSNS